MKLLESFTLGPLELRNRVVMAPMTRSRATPDGVVGELTETYYRQRASMGLLISEAINISPQAVGSPFTPGLYTPAQVDAWRRVTDAVHAAGGRIFAQLWHTGRLGHSSVKGGELPVAPSALRIEGQQHYTPTGMQDYEVPRPLTTDEIGGIVADYRRGRRARPGRGLRRRGAARCVWLPAQPVPGGRGQPPHRPVRRLD